MIWENTPLFAPNQRINTLVGHAAYRVRWIGVLSGSLLLFNNFS